MVLLFPALPCRAFYFRRFATEGLASDFHRPHLPSSSRGDSTKENVSHFARQLLCPAVKARVVPGVNPVHHAEQRKHSRATVKFYSLFFFVVVQKVTANPVVLTFDVRDLAAVFAVEHFILVGEDFHRLLVLEEILQVIMDESANALPWIVPL